ncbi:hypothetical protein SLEP1_g15477 [Rubroshorea leprosula]|uniref:non-specific serine/threonine protein kinase n=1 Tax=Rubroshorea leprosula TaxID=152421 RepID=A0AAV5IY78_9ROSI|nr:hypothetical protein SLEP1_g15477 [Rubroshorea leprosula]
MEPRIQLLFLVVFIQAYIIAAVTDNHDVIALNSVKNIWRNLPPNWVGSDPCGDGWVGIQCMNSRVSSIMLGSMGLEGQLSDDISSLTELQILDLSQNQGLTGPLPASIGNLTKLTKLFLNHCGFTGPIPDTIGSLQQLASLSLNSNKFSGQIPPSIGHLLMLNWLDLSDNQLEGSIPVSDGTTSGLDMLVKTQHFHLGKNKLSGEIPKQIFSSNMTLIHVVLDSNKLIGPIPSTLGLVQSLLVVRFDNNYLSGSVPSNLNNLKNLTDLYLSNNKLSGTLPPLLGMSSLKTLDLSNNSFNTSVIPTWVSSVSSLTTLRMEGTQLQGQFSSDLFSLPNLQTVGLKDNSLSGTLYIGTKFSNQLRLIDLQNNDITDFNETGEHNIEIKLAGNPICQETGRTENYCVPPPQSNSTSFFRHWYVRKNSGSIPQLRGAKCFSFEELKKYTNNFSEANNIGYGGYGKVYRGTLPSGELIAIKRAQQGSMQGALEFKTEIELLSRVHHKNVVSLLGFCFERHEQMLTYEFVPNGTLHEALSGKSGIRLDWTRRLKIALGAARGLAYLHELANPPIIHRDIKSANILLDQHLTAKVADFGLSKPISDREKGHVTTQVKGTMGYMDPEYFMTQQLTEKSDVYSFGVLLLELITARKPIERGKYIVREVRMATDKAKDLHGLHQILDPAILDTSLKGLEKFVALAMRCVEESGADRPKMSEVVKEIESITLIAGMNPNVETPTSSSSYEEASKGSPFHPFSNESFANGSTFPASI